MEIKRSRPRRISIGSIPPKLGFGCKTTGPGPLTRKRSGNCLRRPLIPVRRSSRRLSCQLYVGTSSSTQVRWPSPAIELGPRAPRPGEGHSLRSSAQRGGTVRPAWSRVGTVVALVAGAAGHGKGGAALERELDVVVARLRAGDDPEREAVAAERTAGALPAQSGGRLGRGVAFAEAGAVGPAASDRRKL